MRSIWSVLLVAVMVTMLAGCGGSEKATTSSNAPEWVAKGGGYHDGERGKAFYGVGASTGVTNVQLRRTAAETNARADLARMFKTRVQDMVEVYASALQAGSDGRVSEEASTSQITRALTNMELVGSVVIDHYYDSSDKTQYALVVLDVEGMKSSLDQMKQLSEAQKAAVKKSTEDAFKRLDDNLAKEQ